MSSLESLDEPDHNKEEAKEEAGPKPSRTMRATERRHEMFVARPRETMATRLFPRPELFTGYNHEIIRLRSGSSSRNAEDGTP